MIDKMTNMRKQILDELLVENITVTEARMLNDYIYSKTCDIEKDAYYSYIALESVISESEDDHETHMKLKQKAADLLGKDQKNLINKKYKNDESSKRADARYSAKEKSLKQQDGKNITTWFNPDYNSLTHITKTSPKESDIKLLQYMKKHSNFDNPSEVKKYKAAFKMFCTKYDIDKNSSLYVRYNPDSSSKMEIVEWRESKKMDKKKLDPTNETKLTIPNGYCLIHKSPFKNLTELKPGQTSNRYIGKGRGGVSGQYHATGRVYFVVCKKDDIDAGTWGGMGATCLYTPTRNISGVYVDFEGKNSRNADRYCDIKKLVGKPVYVKTDKPIKVKMINGK